MPVNIVHEISHLPIEWVLIVISIGALHMVGCVLAVICRRRFWKWKNGTKEQAYEKVYCEEDPVPVTENNYTENARPQVHNVQQAFFMEDEEKGEAKHVEQTISEIKRGNEFSKEKDNLGEVWLSMAYRPTAGRLTVGIFSARNLKMDVNGKSDPSVKLSLYNGDKRLKKKTTTVKRSTINPVYNETFTFKVPSNKIGEVSLVISVLDHYRFRPSKPIGQFVLGCKRKIICQWHELQAIKDLPVP